VKNYVLEGNMADFWDREELLGKIEKNNREEIQIKKVEKKGKEYIDIRVFWSDGTSDDFKPSQKGVAIPTEHLEELKDIIGSIK
jgi:phosphopantothenoylcysteine synthetase/decarboxylase